jgi:hypothetical protein
MHELAPYFPYAIRCRWDFNNYTFLFKTLSKASLQKMSKSGYKPIMQRLDHFIGHGNFALYLKKEFIDFEKNRDFDRLSYTGAKVLFENKVDVFKLVDRGLVFDSDKLKLLE